jgi:hypothetical protein
MIYAAARCSSAVGILYGPGTTLFILEARTKKQLFRPVVAIVFGIVVLTAIIAAYSLLSGSIAI